MLHKIMLKLKVAAIFFGQLHEPGIPFCRQWVKKSDIACLSTECEGIALSSHVLVQDLHHHDVNCEKFKGG